MTGSTVSEDVDAILAAGFSRATVPDAATEELEAQLANAREGWESALRIVNSGNEIIKQVGAERDAALAAVERVRAAHREEDHECVECSFESMPDVGFRGVSVPWPCPTIAALDEAPEPEPIVYQYGLRKVGDDSSLVHTTARTLEGVTAWMNENDEVVRRPAFGWESLPDGGEKP